MKRVLITGATGFLGEYLIKELSGDYEVFALGRNQSKAAFIEGMGATFCYGDFTDKEQCRSYFKDMDFVIHAGALSSIWGRWEDFYSANVEGTKMVAQLARENHVERLIFVSSPSIYSAKKDRLNIKEDEADRHNKLNYYIRSKLMAESLLIREFPDLYKVIIRPRGLIGKGDPSLLPRILSANQSIGVPLFHGGRNLVDITCVENVAYSIRLCMEKDHIKDEIFNITNGEPTEFKEILESYFKQAGVTPKYLKMPLFLMYSLAAVLEKYHMVFCPEREPKVTKYTICTLGFSQTLNIKKAQDMLGYAPKISLQQGIEKFETRT